MPPDRPRVLLPYDPREGLTIKQAAGVAGKSEATVRSWCALYDLGRRVGPGGWIVSKVALAAFLENDAMALEAYLAGDRSSDLVRPYFERFKLGDLLQREGSRQIRENGGAA